MCQKAFQEHGSEAHFVSSSGGNAGLAAAYASRQLGCKSTIIVPQTCTEFMIKKLRAEGATVIMEGEVSFLLTQLLDACMSCLECH
jgi:L-serine/L-threonine ammonia-lyase